MSNNRKISFPSAARSSALDTIDTARSLPATNFLLAQYQSTNNMPPTGASSLNRRGARLPPGEGFPLTKYVGLAAAAMFSVASGVSLYEKHKDQYLDDPHGMPKRIKNQILGIDDDEDDDGGYPPARANSASSASNRRNVASSTVTIVGGDLSTGHLQSLQDEYKTELIERNEQGDYKVGPSNEH